MVFAHRIAQPRFTQNKAITQMVVDVLEACKVLVARRIIVEILLLERSLFPAINQIVVPLDVQIACMRAESLVRQKLRRIDDLVAARRRECLAAVGSIDAVLFEPRHTLLAADRSLAIGAPGAVIVLRSQIAIVEHSHAIHRVTLGLRNLGKLFTIDMEVNSPVVKAQDLRRIVSRARKDLEFGRSITEHQVHRLGHAIVGNARVRMHLAVGAVHAHLKRHNHVGIFRKHGRQLRHMLEYPLVGRSHVAAAIVPRVITDAHNHIALVRADIVEGLLQDIQRIFRQVLALAPGRIFLVASLFNAQPGTTAEFRNFGTQMQQLAIRFFNRHPARRF